MDLIFNREVPSKVAGSRCRPFGPRRLFRGQQAQAQREAAVACGIAQADHGLGGAGAGRGGEDEIEVVAVGGRGFLDALAAEGHVGGGGAGLEGVGLY
jgi:hypothetical protein